MAEKYSYWAICSLILSLLFFVPFLPALGIISGVIALIADKGRKGRGLAIAGILMGILFLILQMAVAFTFFNFVSTLLGIVQGGSPQEQVDRCLEKGNGTSKDMCIILAITTNANISSTFDPALCDREISDVELIGYCNALLKRDKSFCYNISHSDTRIKCFGLIDELQRKS